MKAIKSKSPSVRSKKLTPAQQAALPAIAKMLGLQDEALTKRAQFALYQRFCSIPFDHRTDLKIIEERLHLVYEALHAVCRAETNQAIRQTSPSHPVRAIAARIEEQARHLGNDT